MREEKKLVRNPALFYKTFVVGVIVLFVGAGIQPSINASIIGLNRDTTTFEINFFTLEGIEKIEKEVSTEDAQYLLDLMDGSDYNKIAFELNRLNLLPEDMNVKQAEELINGNYGKENFKDFQNKLNFKPSSNPDIKSNSFCIVRGNAVDNWMEQLMLTIAFYSIVFSGIFLILFDLIFCLLSDWYANQWDYFSPLFNLGFFLLFNLGPFIHLIYDLIPLKVAAISYAYLEDTSLPPLVYPNVNTSGLQGKWNMNKYEILLGMIGFFGIWLNYNDIVNDFACKFMGFALYVNVRGYDKTV